MLRFWWNNSKRSAHAPVGRRRQSRSAHPVHHTPAVGLRHERRGARRRHRPPTLAQERAQWEPCWAARHHVCPEMKWTALSQQTHCTAHRCTPLHCTALHCTVHRIASHRTSTRINIEPLHTPERDCNSPSRLPRLANPLFLATAAATSFAGGRHRPPTLLLLWRPRCDLPPKTTTTTATTTTTKAHHAVTTIGDGPSRQKWTLFCPRPFLFPFFEHSPSYRLLWPSTPHEHLQPACWVRKTFPKAPRPPKSGRTTRHSAAGRDQLQRKHTHTHSIATSTHNAQERHVTAQRPPSIGPIDSTSRLFD